LKRKVNEKIQHCGQSAQVLTCRTHPEPSRRGGDRMWWPQPVGQATPVGASKTPASSTRRSDRLASGFRSRPGGYQGFVRFTRAQAPVDVWAANRAQPVQNNGRASSLAPPARADTAQRAVAYGIPLVAQLQIQSRTSKVKPQCANVTINSFMKMDYEDPAAHWLRKN